MKAGVGKARMALLGTLLMLQMLPQASAATVTDACIFYLSCARNFINYFEGFKNADDELSQKERNDLFALYQLCTLFVAWNAMREKNIREVIGIRKSLFFR